MFCSNCGAQLDAKDQFCKACGAPAGATANVQQPQQPAPVVQAPVQPMPVAVPQQVYSTPVDNTPPGYSGLAIAGFVLSVLMTGLPGLILSILGLNSCKKTGKRGKGFAIAGIIAGASYTLGYIFLIFVFTYLAINGEGIH